MSGQHVKTRPARAAPPRIGRHAARLIEDLARVTRYVDPALAARWPEIVGPEFAALSRPGRLTGGRANETLEIYVPSGAAAARLQAEIEIVRGRVNAYLGPERVRRIALRQSAAAAAPGGAASDRLDGALARFRASIADRFKN
jgi:hypothetical protein